MEKKKIIIVSHNLRIGGVERSLLGLLNGFDYGHYEVDLFLFIHDGEFMPLIPKEVNLLPEIKKYTSLLIDTKQNIHSGYFDILLGKLYARWKAKRFCTKNHIVPEKNMVYFNYQQRYTTFALPDINPQKTYDLAISFLAPHYIAAAKVRAARRVAWIHTDYSYFGFDKQLETDMWDKYDYIASVSNNVSEGFIKQFSSLSDRIVMIENILSPDFVLQQADTENVSSEMPKENGITLLCSAGRFVHQKNFDNVPFICKKLWDMGCKVKWYLLGYGGDENLIRSKIEEAGMQENVIILGKKENPYPYMKTCDVYVQPSRYEGKAVTVREAQILCKPVVITDFATAGSQLRNGIDGVVVPMDNDGCAKGIKSLIDNKNMQEVLTANCRNSDFGNEKETGKIYKLI